MQALVKMKAGPGELHLKELPIPQPQAGQVRIKVKRAGICQTDIEYYHAGPSVLNPPVTLGHEVSGIVDRAGDGVQAFKPGDRVIAQTTYYVCGKCRYCRRWDYNHCPHRQGIGSVSDGGFAEYIVLPEESVMKLPDSLSFEEGATIEPLACGVHALVEQTSIPLDSIVVVLGPGTIGMFTAQVAVAQGAYVVMAGLNQDEERLALTRRLGIQRTVNLEKEDLFAVVNELSDGYGADYVVECAGAVKAVDMALKIVAKKGVFVAMGVYTEHIPVDFVLIHRKEINVIGSKSQIPSSWGKAVKLVLEGRVKAKELVTDVFPLSRWEDAFKKFERKEGIKIMLDPEK